MWSNRRKTTSKLDICLLPRLVPSLFPTQSFLWISWWSSLSGIHRCWSIWFIACRGDPILRTSMSFLVENEYNDLLWLPSYSLGSQICLDTTLDSHYLCCPYPRSICRLRGWLVRDFGPPAQGLVKLFCPLCRLHKTDKQITFTCPLLKHSSIVDNVWIQIYAFTPSSGVSHRVDQELVDSCLTLHTLQSPTTVSQSDFDYLIGIAFYAADAKHSCLVPRLSTTRTRDIVIHISSGLTSGRMAPVDNRLYHVADVVQM